MRGEALQRREERLNMDGRRHLSVPWPALKALPKFVWSLENWREVWGACGAAARPPPLIFRNGLILYHGGKANVPSFFEELIVDETHTQHGFYEPKPEDTVLDLGANIGLFAVYLQSCAPGIHVHCFEPVPEAFRWLKVNVTANHIEDVVKIYPLTLHDGEGVVHHGQADLASRGDRFESEFVEGEDGGPGEGVSLVQAVNDCNVERFDLVKIDVEGSRMEVLNATDQETWDRIERIALEFHEGIRPECRHAVTDILSRSGFQRIEVTPTPERFGIIQASR